MKRINLLLFATLTAFLAGCQQQVSNNNSDPRVWNQPSTERSTFTFSSGGWEFDIQKVLFGDTETTVYMKVRGYKGQAYTFAAGTVLKADGKTYKLQSLDGLVPGEYKPMGSTNSDDLVFHFEPMPLSTKSFDLVESEFNPRAFNVYGIHMTNHNSPALRNTHWRNLRTGDWTISFMDDYVIYDCKVWKYDTALTDSTTAAQTITISNDGNQATVHIGALKSGHRTIKVQASKDTRQFRCALFDSKRLPEYPRVGRRSNRLVDYGYDAIDSVTVSGILIGQGRSNTTYTIDVIDPIGGDNPNFVFDTDENGFFTVTFPLANVSDGVVRHRRGSAGFSMPVEPGRTYFVYSDITTGRQFVMGEKSRIQNDFFTHHAEFFVNYDRIEESPFESDQDAYLDYLIGLRDRQFARLDSLKKVCPSISDGFLDMSRVYATIALYESIGQARFHNQEQMYSIPTRLLNFIISDMKVNSIKPYSLYYDFNYFMRDFTQNFYQQAAANLTVSLSDIIKYVIDNNKVELTADEQELALWLGQINDRIGALVKEFQNDQDRLSDTLNTLLTPDMQPKMEKASQLLTDKEISEYANAYLNKITSDKEFSALLDAMDTLGLDRRLNDIMLTHYLNSQIKSSRHSAPAAVMARFDSIVTYKPCLDAVHASNEKYLALENADLASLGNTVSDQEIAQMSDGELILRKLTEPYRGKIVYIDVWGSWCHPCLENLQHAGELKEALKDFDIVYLYLASGTSDSAWKGVIKEYELTGHNCVHYNLPTKQQTLVEQFLGVQGYPTYRLLNRNGALIDAACSPNNLPALIETLKKL